MSDGRAPADTAGVIAPPPLIALAALIIGVVGDWLLPLDALESVLNWPARIIIGAVLLLGGGALVVVGERAFKQVGTNEIEAVVTIHWKKAGKEESEVYTTILLKR